MMPALTNNAVEGVTRAALITLFREARGLEVRECDIARTERYLAEEAFFCGSAAEVTAELLRRPPSPRGGVVGPLMTKIREAYFPVVGSLDRSHPEWHTPVYA